MGKEIKLETLPQDLIIDDVHPSLPCGAGVRDQNVHTAERFDNLAEGRLHGFRIGNICGDAEAANRCRCIRDRLGVLVE